jgi:cytoskeletal protein RodZ
MDPIQQPSQPVAPMNQMPTPQDMSMPGQQTSEHKPIGPIVAILVIVLILIAGAIYVWGQKLHSEDITPDSTSSVEQTSSADTAQSTNITDTTITTENTAAVSNADDVPSLQKEIDANSKGLDDVNF